MLSGRRVLLIIGGGIAAFKSLELIRELRRHGAAVTPVLTKAGAEFVTPLSASALAAERVFQDLFDLTDEAEMGHIELSRSADVLAVVPATADLMAKAANGIAGDLASTLLLATDKRVLMAPAMNVRMWQHPATQRNLATLQADGVVFAGPVEGDMACGEYGPGRMLDVPEIVAAISGMLSSDTPAQSGRARPLEGRHALVTSGPTHEPIDPVRYIANRSSGAQGTAIAEALRDLGARVTFVTGPADMAPPPGVDVRRVQTAQEMSDAVDAALPADVAVFAAAVADWRVAEQAAQKMKKTEGQEGADLKLTQNPDILARVAGLAPEARPQLVVGFAAETEEVVAHGTAKRLRKGCDWILANDVSPASGVMGGAENQVHLITEDGVEDWPRLGKAEVARALADRIVTTLRGAR